MDLTRELLHALPDLPRWVELRSHLLEGTATVEGEPSACVVRGDDGAGSPQLFVVGKPPADLLTRMLSQSPAELLVPPESHEHVAAILGRRGLRADLLTLRQPLPRQAPPETRIISSLADAPAFPPELEEELRAALRRVPLAVALEAEQAVAFCYPGSISESLWDVSIDTLAGFRRRGHAMRAVRAMMMLMAGRGRVPIWGASEDNPASSHLAHKLGFQEADELYLF
ncbi:GNAT family N-acetyltransferase [Archangium sp.]|jgi:RimJ/RimL family protein N-acetyltransferase|uniref:GNAT family N-acetyltransferase n=1 Tax=Archangium sp. TaxID=1872627 RepID=UPI002ED988E8